MAKKQAGKKTEKVGAKTGVKNVDAKSESAKITGVKESADVKENTSAETARAQTLAGSWTFLTNHAHVLVCLSAAPDARLRDVALQVGITERAVQRIVADLEAGGILVRERDGRRNRYEIAREKTLRHALEGHRTVGDLLDLVASSRQS